MSRLELDNILFAVITQIVCQMSRFSFNDKTVKIICFHLKAVSNYLLLLNVQVNFLDGNVQSGA